MSKKTFDRVALHDAYTAASVVTVVGNITTISGLPQIVSPQMRVKAVTIVLGQAETAQVLTVILASTPIASTRYVLKAKFMDEFLEKHSAEMSPLSVVTSTALSGSVPTDKHNIYAALAYRFNSQLRFSRYATARAIFTLAFSGQTVSLTAGSTVVGGTSGARGIIVSQSDAGATGTLTLATIPGYSSTFTSAEALTEILSTGAAGTGDGAAGTLTLGISLTFTDRTGYYPINGFRGGALMLSASEGFIAANIATTTPAVYSLYTGTNLLAQIPVKEYSSENLSSGYIDHANLNNSPTSGNTYNLLIVDVEEGLQTNVIDGAAGVTGALVRKYGLYLNAGDADYAATLAAVQALIS